MATVKMMQGDSYPVPVSLKVDGVTLTPDLVEEVELCIGENIRKTSSSGEVRYDPGLFVWHFTLTQQETLGMEPDAYSVIARVKYKNYTTDIVNGVECGKIIIRDTYSQEVL